jgi:hypothetical protein
MLGSAGEDAGGADAGGAPVGEAAGVAAAPPEQAAVLRLIRSPATRRP